MQHLRDLDKDKEWLITFVKVDVTCEESVNTAVNVIARDFRGIDILLCFAGITESKLAIEYPIDSWRRIFDVNVHGSFLVARAVARSSFYVTINAFWLTVVAETPLNGPARFPSSLLRPCLATLSISRSRTLHMQSRKLAYITLPALWLESGSVIAFALIAFLRAS